MNYDQTTIFTAIGLVSCMVVVIAISWAERIHDRNSRTFRSTGRPSVCACGKRIDRTQSVCIDCTVRQINAQKKIDNAH